MYLSKAYYCAPLAGIFKLNIFFFLSEKREVEACIRGMYGQVQEEALHFHPYSVPQTQT